MNIKSNKMKIWDLCLLKTDGYITEVTANTGNDCIVFSACEEAYEEKDESEACSLGCKNQKPFSIDSLLKVSDCSCTWLIKKKCR